uniref:Uncharacterized protein n=1 Tax=Chromera velia CCMP2878 TaxID=1169474 RepID=A0A0G4GCY5_9ALVE|eukprot:Cvel_21213.t1-p1 / transcript=Cvel_21213.t1 / gene=Cvel_21213 / organism=Chromera_velia_CCMP2878 / gene_product=hypothetical protein / transcript_product=hypothetical protein / location=Cvel_scaffold1970:11204-11902(+) / protein_length=233 / sequence_SO=supercontig / SO=protein_coding / is_pseudo=false
MQRGPFPPGGGWQAVDLDELLRNLERGPMQTGRDSKAGRSSRERQQREGGSGGSPFPFPPNSNYGSSFSSTFSSSSSTGDGAFGGRSRGRFVRGQQRRVEYVQEGSRMVERSTTVLHYSDGSVERQVSERDLGQVAGPLGPEGPSPFQSQTGGRAGDGREKEDGPPGERGQIQGEGIMKWIGDLWSSSEPARRGVQAGFLVMAQRFVRRFLTRFFRQVFHRLGDILVRALTRR